MNEINNPYYRFLQNTEIPQTFVFVSGPSFRIDGAICDAIHTWAYLVYTSQYIQNRKGPIRLWLT